jgi:hypothetical protein
LFVLIKLDIYGYSDGGASVNGIYGPFATRAEAEALEKRVDSQGLVGVSYAVKEIESSDKLVAFLNQLGIGKV